MTRTPGPHIFRLHENGWCAVCGSPRSADVHNVSDIQANRVCINCLTTHGKARRLEWVNGAWECMTFGGCGGRSSERYLDKVASQTERMMKAFGIIGDDVITKDTTIRALPKLTGERRVILPDDNDEPQR